MARVKLDLNKVNADKLSQLIKKGLNGKTYLQRIQIMERWINDKRDSRSPVAYLGEKKYNNYLNYLAVNAVDEKINNVQPFVPEQNYQHEYERLFKLNSLDGIFKNDEEFQQYYYTIDSAMQDRSFRKMQDKNSNKVVPKINKLRF